MQRIMVAAMIALAATGCVQKIAESRVRSALVDAGLSDRNADCMAGRVVDRISIGQLRKLEALETFVGERRPLADYVAAVRRVGDAELLSVIASSGALCTTGLAR
ncbi:hypothetical protein GCM10011371_07090 [Novosphingobium marinum]|uniref:Lipoprotein n=1 Tax=Novosphingobium marinum TaxID=1514948 RepID=A0A7Y9XWI0_9SPHN|nr:hypothetical protein [Novosphingobium marinum]NYH94396.1 hypothetical protein [Novosphingobium marinum]GGC22048.1 hypothetical protein GCM10011371_07090 [Novosphingobium marinum]